MARAPLPKGITLRPDGQFQVDKQIKAMRYVETFDSLADAELFIAAVKAGNYEMRKALSVEQISLREACNRYIDELVRRSRSNGDIRSVYNSLANALYGPIKHYQLLNNIHWEFYWANFTNRYSASYANSISTFAYGVQKYAYDRHWTNKEPERMGRLPITEKRTRYISTIEERQCEDFLRDQYPEYLILFYFYLDTGCRKSEAFSLEWRDVEFDRNTITIWGQDAKSGRTRTVPMTSRVRECLNTLSRYAPVDETTIYRLNTGKVFDFLSKRRFERIWTKMRNEMMLSDDKQFVIHAMRHTCCTRLLASGVDIRHAQEWMGHKDIRDTASYAHVVPIKLQSAVKALEGYNDTQEGTWAQNL